MKIESSAFKEGEMIPAKYTCDGEGINPPLSFSEIPAEAKSLALIMEDPDSPHGLFIHWTTWNIDPKTPGIAENSFPAGAIEGKTSFGKIGFGGSCPHAGTHRYFFRLLALDSMLDLPAGSSKGELDEAMAGKIISSAALVGNYKRP